MTPDQEQHVSQILLAFIQEAQDKYAHGAKEHGGNIWDMTDEQLENEELKEIIDLVIYRYTRLLKKRIMKSEGNLPDEKPHRKHQ